MGLQLYITILASGEDTMEEAEWEREGPESGEFRGCRRKMRVIQEWISFVARKGQPWENMSCSKSGRHLSCLSLRIGKGGCQTWNFHCSHHTLQLKRLLFFCFLFSRCVFFFFFLIYFPTLFPLWTVMGLVWVLTKFNPYLSYYFIQLKREVLGQKINK